MRAQIGEDRDVALEDRNEPAELGALRAVHGEVDLVLGCEFAACLRKFLAMMNILDALLHADGDQNAEHNDEQMHEKIAAGNAAMGRRMDVDHGYVFLNRDFSRLLSSAFGWIRLGRCSFGWFGVGCRPQRDRRRRIGMGLHTCGGRGVVLLFHGRGSVAESIPTTDRWNTVGQPVVYPGWRVSSFLLHSYESTRFVHQNSRAQTSTIEGGEIRWVLARAGENR